MCTVRLLRPAIPITQKLRALSSPASMTPRGIGSEMRLSGQLDRRKGHTHIRPAGRKKMDLPPSTWSKTDEEVDKSFPASIPPGNY